MPKKKIKDMTPVQLKTYRKRQKKQKEKEVREEERKTKRKAVTAKKVTAIRKRNKAKEVREKIKKVKQRTRIAKKAATTRKKNSAAVKRVERERKKIELEKKREERRKNKIVVPRSKPIKDMTPEEYYEYKQEYSHIYNTRKKKALKQQQNKDIKRKLSGKTLNTWNSITERKMENVGKVFSDRKENTRYLMHPRTRNKNASFRSEDLNIYVEITAAANVIVTDKKKRVNVSLSMFILPNGMSSSHLILSDFWIKDVSQLLPELTDKNYQELLQPITHQQIEKIMKWTTLDFMKVCIDCCQRHKLSTSEILWQCLDRKYAKEHEITFDTLNTMTKTKKKCVNNI